MLDADRRQCIVLWLVLRSQPGMLCHSQEMETLIEYQATRKECEHPFGVSECVRAARASLHQIECQLFTTDRKDTRWEHSKTSVQATSNHQRSAVLPNTYASGGGQTGVHRMHIGTV